MDYEAPIMPCGCILQMWCGHLCLVLPCEMSLDRTGFVCSGSSNQICMRTAAFATTVFNLSVICLICKMSENCEMHITILFTSSKCLTVVSSSTAVISVVDIFLTVYAAMFRLTSTAGLEVLCNTVVWCFFRILKHFEIIILSGGASLNAHPAVMNSRQM